MKLLDVTKSKYHGRNVNEVVVPPQLRTKIKTGIPFIDFVLGGGVTPSTCWMVTGDPGVGKTTLMLTIANAFMRAGHVPIVNGREESVFQMKMAVERLGLDSGFILGEDLYVQDLIAHAESIQKKLEKENAGLPIDKQRRVIVIPDSLQCLDDNKYDTGRRTKNTPVNCAQELIKWAKGQTGKVKDENKHAFGVLMFINHVTKEGNFAGDNTILHAVDARLHFGFDRNKKSETYGERVLTKLKDRFGPAAPPMCVEMGVGGTLQEKVIEEEPDVDEEVAEAEREAAE